MVVSIQMRKFRIYTARQAIISGGRGRCGFFARTFYRDRTDRRACETIVAISAVGLIRRAAEVTERAARDKPIYEQAYR